MSAPATTHAAHRLPFRHCILFVVLWMAATAPEVIGQDADPTAPAFSGRIDCGILDTDEIDEASGIAASRRNPGILWTHNDSGDDARVFAIDIGGTLRAEFRLKGIDARDWEDIAVGPGPEPDVSYLYIGDIGDNNGIYPTKWVYRVPEPVIEPDRDPYTATLDGIDRIALAYPEHARDAETLMVDPATRDICIVSKREDQVGIYRAPYPQTTNGISVLDRVGTLSFTMAVGGDISPDGTEILIKTYDTVYYWVRNDGESVADVLARTPAHVPYISEPQGEAICWDADGSGYYTISEQSGNNPVHLYYFERGAAR